MHIGIYMMQKNEGSLLRRWVDYHTKVLGVRALNVFDNMSDDYETKSLLDEIEREGVRVVRGVANFNSKGVIISEAIANSGTRYDWCFPLDCDEFLSLYDGGYSTDLAKFAVALAEVPKEKYVLRIEKYVLNIPYTEKGYRHPTKKLAVRGGHYLRMDKGFHLYSWENRADMIDPQLLFPVQFAYLHFHNKYFAKVLEAARYKLQGRVKSIDAETLRVFEGEGRHLVKYFFMSEVEYLASFEKPDVDFRPVFDGVGIEIPFSFQMIRRS